MIGSTDGGRVLTLVIERTIDPTTWLIVTGWNSTVADYVERHEGDPNATLRILVSVEGEDARRLERIAGARGTTPHDLVAELLRDADRPAA